MQKHQKNILFKVLIGSVASSIFFLGLMHLIGYERSEILAFALLIGLSIAALK